MSATLGSELKRIREEKGITIEDAARTLRMRPVRLIEIEDDEYGNFPSLAYARGFVVNYGKFLNLDVRPYLRDFEFVDPIASHNFPVAPAQPAPAYRPFGRPGEKQKRKKPPVFSLLLVLVLVAISAGGYYVYMMAERIGVFDAPAVTVEETEASSAPASSAPEARPDLEETQSTAEVRSLSNEAEESMDFELVAPLTADRDASSTAYPTSTLGFESFTGLETEPVDTGLLEIPVPEMSGSADETREIDSLATPAGTGDPSGNSADHRGSSTLVMHPVKRTWVKVVVNEEMANPAFQDWVEPDDQVLLRGERFFVEVRDIEAVLVYKNGSQLEPESGRFVVD